LSTIEWNSNQDKIYLNWGSAERIRKDVVIAEKKFLGWQLAFEDQPEKAIRVLREAISVSRKKIGALIKATPSRSIIFTTGTEESLKTVLFRHDIIPYGSEIVITDCEFYGIHSKISPPRYHPRIAAIWNLDDPAAIVDAISREVNSNTRLLLISHVTYNSGALLPIAEITEECKRKNPELFVLIDGAQAIGHIPVDVQRLKCDFYAGDAHKWFLGPDQTGFLYVQNQDHLQKIAADQSSIFSIHPELNHSKGSRSGAVAYELAAIGESMLFEDWQIIQDIYQQNCYLADIFKKRIESELGDRFEIHSPEHVGLKTGIVCLSLKNNSSVTKVSQLAHALLKKRIYLSIIYPPPKILTGYPSQPPMLRFCFHYWNTEEEIERVVYELVNKKNTRIFAQ